MSAPTLTEIMDGLDARLATITALNHAAYLADQINPPQTVVRVPNVDDYQATFDADADLRFSVIVLVSAALDRTGQQKLAEFASRTGTNSIPLALEDDTVSITGVDQVVVESFRNLDFEEVGVIGYYGGEFTVLAMTSG